MPYSDIYLYSPLSVKTVQEGSGRALLLQFLLSEIFHSLDAEKRENPLEFVLSPSVSFFPYDWAYEIGCLNKIGEHAQLLNHAFPKLKEATDLFHTHLEGIVERISSSKKREEDFLQSELVKDLHTLYRDLEPLICACKENEALATFLQKKGEEIKELAHYEE